MLPPVLREWSPRFRRARPLPFERTDFDMTLNVETSTDRAAQATPIIELRHVDKHFGDLHVLKDVNLSVDKGEAVSYTHLIAADMCKRKPSLRVDGVGFSRAPFIRRPITLTPECAKLVLLR